MLNVKSLNRKKERINYHYYKWSELPWYQKVVRQPLERKYPNAGSSHYSPYKKWWPRIFHRRSYIDAMFPLLWSVWKQSYRNDEELSGGFWINLFYRVKFTIIFILNFSMSKKQKKHSYLNELVVYYTEPVSVWSMDCSNAMDWNELIVGKGIISNWFWYDRDNSNC